MIFHRQGPGIILMGTCRTKSNRIGAAWWTSNFRAKKIPIFRWGVSLLITY